MPLRHRCRRRLPSTPPLSATGSCWVCHWVTCHGPRATCQPVRAMGWPSNCHLPHRQQRQEQLRELRQWLGLHQRRWQQQW